MFAYWSALSRADDGRAGAPKEAPVSERRRRPAGELDGMLDCVQNEDVGDERPRVLDALDYGARNKFCSGDYTITDDEVAEIEALGDD